MDELALTKNQGKSNKGFVSSTGFSSTKYSKNFFRGGPKAIRKQLKLIKKQESIIE